MENVATDDLSGYELTWSWTRLYPIAWTSTEVNRNAVGTLLLVVWKLPDSTDFEWIKRKLSHQVLILLQVSKRRDKRPTETWASSNMTSYFTALPPKFISLLDVGVGLFWAVPGSRFAWIWFDPFFFIIALLVEWAQPATWNENNQQQQQKKKTTREWISKPAAAERRKPDREPVSGTMRFSSCRARRCGCHGDGRVFLPSRPVVPATWKRNENGRKDKRKTNNESEQKRDEGATEPTDVFDDPSRPAIKSTANGQLHKRRGRKETKKELEEERGGGGGGDDEHLSSCIAGPLTLSLATAMDA